VEQSHPSLWLSILAYTAAWARAWPLRPRLDVVARSLGLTARAGDPRVGFMSRSWLREQEAEADKHSVGR